MVNDALLSDIPCSCGYHDMELKSIELVSRLTGTRYDCVRCSKCKSVFHAESLAVCDECGANHEGDHMGWCSQSDADWPDDAFTGKAQIKR